MEEFPFIRLKKRFSSRPPVVGRSSRRWAWIGAFAALLIPAFPLAQEAADEVKIQRYLVDLYLGDSMADIESIYPPTRKWPSYLEPRGHVRRMKLEGISTKRFPAGVDVLWLGVKRHKLVEIKVIYDAEFSAGKTAEELAGDIALIYGAPKRTGTKLWWDDGTTVMRVFATELPVLRDGGRAVEIRTCIQLMNEGLLRRKRKYP